MILQQDCRHNSLVKSVINVHLQTSIKSRKRCHICTWMLLSSSFYGVCLAFFAIKHQLIPKQLDIKNNKLRSFPFSFFFFILHAHVNYAKTVLLPCSVLRYSGQRSKRLFRSTPRWIWSKTHWTSSTILYYCRRRNLGLCQWDWRKCKRAR